MLTHTNYSRTLFLVMFVLDEDKKEERGHGPLYLYLSGSVLENTLESK